MADCGRCRRPFSVLFRFIPYHSVSAPPAACALRNVPCRRGTQRQAQTAGHVVDDMDDMDDMDTGPLCPRIFVQTGHRPHAVLCPASTQSTQSTQSIFSARRIGIASCAPSALKTKKRTCLCAKQTGPKKIPGTVLLSHSQIYSTIAAGGLNYRVREGNVCDSSAMGAGKNYNEEKRVYGNCR